MTLDLFIFSAAIFGTVTSLLLLAINGLAHYDSQVDDRLAGLVDTPPSRFSGKNRQTKNWQRRDGTAQSNQSSVAFKLLPDRAAEHQRLQTRLINAGIYSPLAPSIYMFAKLLLMLLPPIGGIGIAYMGFVSPYLGIVGGSLLGLFGLCLPSLWLRAQKRKWHSTIARSLADFLDLMVACLEVGLSAEAALQRATDELRIAHPRLAMELSAVQAQIELGASSDTALKNFADRSDNDAIRSLAAVVQQGRRLGGGMAEVFRQQAESLRMRREFTVEEKAQQAAVKILVPTLLFIFPVIFVVLAGPAVIKLCNMFGNESRNTRVGRR